MTAAQRRLLPMRPDHVPQVLAIERRSTGYPWSEANFRDSLQTGYSAWVITDGDCVLAYALMSMLVGEAQILNIVVAPEHRREGLARQLMDHLLRLALAGINDIMLLEVRPSNGPALRLYESYGFEEIGRRRNYYRSAQGEEDALVLSLALPRNLSDPAAP